MLNKAGRNGQRTGAAAEAAAMGQDIHGSSGADTLTGTQAGEFIQSYEGTDLVTAGGGNDRVYAGTGADRIFGETGGDELYGGDGNDLIDGGEGDDRLTGGTGNDRLLGGDGNDWFEDFEGADRLEGGAGNDIYGSVEDDDVIVETADGGYDRVGAAVHEYVLPDFVEELMPAGGAGNFSWNPVRFTGNASNNEILGSGADDILSGADGNDTLLGYDGADQLHGGRGDDRLVVNDAGDAVHELAGEGDDTVSSSVSYMLGSHVENLELLWWAPAIDGTGNALDNWLTGNDEANRLSGGAGDDHLHGEGGDDVLIGGSGRDTASYLWDQSGVAVSLAVAGPQNIGAQGWDTLSSIENLEGSSFDDRLTGDGRANSLYGMAGADRMTGGGGNDQYRVGNAGDRAIETEGGGNDLVFASISLRLAAHVEQLTLVGETAIDGTGNGLANVLSGNAAANRLDGGGGGDLLAGGGGDDLYVVDDAADVVREAAGAGIDTVRSAADHLLATHVEHLRLTGLRAIDGTGNGLANEITGNGAANLLSGGAGADALAGGAGEDRLAGGAGSDRLAGGLGRDRFEFDAALGRDVDTMLDFTVGEDTIRLDRAVFEGIGSDGRLGASAFAEGRSAGEGEHRIVYDETSGRLFYDADGVGGAAQTLFGRVDPGTALSHDDFIAFSAPASAAAARAPVFSAEPAEWNDAVLLMSQRSSLFHDDMRLSDLP